MQIKQRLTSKKKHILMSNSIKFRNSNRPHITNHNSQNFLKEFKEFYDSNMNEVVKIRLMTKWQLSNYMRMIDSNKAIQIARKIKDRREFNKYVGKDIRKMFSNYMFAKHRYFSLTK